MEYKIDSIILVRAGLVRIEVTTLKFGEIVIPIEFEVTDGLEKEDEFEKTLKKS